MKDETVSRVAPSLMAILLFWAILSFIGGIFLFCGIAKQYTDHPLGCLIFGSIMNTIVLIISIYLMINAIRARREIKGVKP